VSRRLDREQIAAAISGLRDPLARIALAVSSPARAASAEAREQRAESVSAALADVDARIDELLRVLRAETQVPAHGDCRASFASACERARPAAFARGLALRERAPSESVPGDSAQVARATLRLLRVACAWTGAHGCVELALERSALGLTLRCLAAPPGAAPRTSKLGELLSRFALAEGARVHGLESLAGRELKLALELQAPAAC
jgi:hypothetical protein